MKVNKKQVIDTFAAYVEKYDAADEKVRLKIEHTYRVSELCEKIADSLNLAEEDKDLAWLLGMLHDVGRFEQLRQYGTFSDVDSIDHAKFGAEILFDQGEIRNYCKDSSEDSLIRTAIEFHSAYRIPGSLDERTKQFCHILRDADKIDILKVNVDFSLEDIYNVSTKALRNCMVTKEVMEGFAEHHAILRSLKKTPVDNVVGHLALVFELVYPFSRQEVLNQGYIDRLLHFESENEVTQQQFMQLREIMNRYLGNDTCGMVQKIKNGKGRMASEGYSN